MSTTAQFLHDLSQLGIQVVLQNGRVHVRGLQEALTPDMRWLLGKRRDELQVWLSLSDPASDNSVPMATENASAYPTSPSLACVTTAQTFLSTVVLLAQAHCAHPGRVAMD